MGYRLRRPKIGSCPRSSSGCYPGNRYLISVPLSQRPLLRKAVYPDGRPFLEYRSFPYSSLQRTGSSGDHRYDREDFTATVSRNIAPRPGRLPRLRSG